MPPQKRLRQSPGEGRNWLLLGLSLCLCISVYNIFLSFRFKIHIEVESMLIGLMDNICFLIRIHFTE